MTKKVNGAAASGYFLGKELEFWTVNTSLDITPTGVAAPASVVNPAGEWPMDAYGQTWASEADYTAAYASQNRFNKLIEVISTRTQPVILGTVVEESDGENTSYVLKFAVEHAMAWDDAEVSLEESLEGVADFDPGTNVEVTKNDVL